MQNCVVCLKDSTEQSESNPGHSLGTIASRRRTVWKTVPSEAPKLRQRDFSLFTFHSSLFTKEL